MSRQRHVIGLVAQVGDRVVLLDKLWRVRAVEQGERFTAIVLERMNWLGVCKRVKMIFPRGLDQ